MKSDVCIQKYYFIRNIYISAFTFSYLQKEKINIDLQINSKTLWFKVENEADRQIIDRIVQTGRIPLTCCEMLLSVGDNILLYNRNKKMFLRHGIDTLQKTLQLTNKPERIKPESALPDYFFQTYLNEGIIDDENAVKLAGDITRIELRSLVVD